MKDSIFVFWSCTVHFVGNASSLGTGWVEAVWRRQEGSLYPLAQEIKDRRKEIAGIYAVLPSVAHPNYLSCGEDTIALSFLAATSGPCAILAHISSKPDRSEGKHIRSDRKSDKQLKDDACIYSLTPLCEYTLLHQVCTQQAGEQPATNKRAACNPSQHPVSHPPAASQVSHLPLPKPWLSQ
jgi:hypothetical protein